MKFYLSSYRLGKEPQKLASLFGENKKVAVIANSMDFLEDTDQRKLAANREIDDLKNLGLEAQEIDLRNYFGKPDELSQVLSKFAGVWVRGGNVFVLGRAYKESGMDEWLRSQTENHDFVYAGYSAGVCVLAPSLKGYELVDNPQKVPEGYKSDVEWQGVGLLSWAFAPHYKSNHPESESVSLLVEHFKKADIEHKAVSDGDVIIQE